MVQTTDKASHLVGNGYNDSRIYINEIRKSSNATNDFTALQSRIPKGIADEGLLSK